MSDEPIIALNGVTKRYAGGREALSGVSFAIQAGEMVFLSGRSGAGKTTLLKLIAAIERPTAGSVLVGGQNVGALSERAIGDNEQAPRSPAQMRPKAGPA